MTGEPIIKYSEAAKALGISERYLASLAAAKGFAVRRGGTDALPRFGCYLSEARRVVSRERSKPAPERRISRRVSPSACVHASVANW